MFVIFFLCCTSDVSRFFFDFHARCLLIRLHFAHLLIISNRMSKRQRQLELLVEVEGVAEEGVVGEGDLCGGRLTRTLLKNKTIIQFGWG